MTIKLFTVDTDYCNYLRQFDKCVPFNMDNKSARPFVGIVFSINDFNYYAPLTSPKKKHLTMKNQMDFLKIHNGIYGAINFNNMIPVHKSCLHLADMDISPSDTQDEIKYKQLLQNQFIWCNDNKETIKTYAQKLYNNVVLGKARPSLLQRCCDFKLDEQQCKNYCINIKRIDINSTKSIKDKLSEFNSEQASITLNIIQSKKQETNNDMHPKS